MAIGENKLQIDKYSLIFRKLNQRPFTMKVLPMFSFYAVFLFTMLVSGQRNRDWEKYEDVAEDEELPKKVLQIDLHSWQKQFNENQKLLVLFYKKDNCAKCESVVKSLEQLLGQPEVDGCDIGKSDDVALAKKLGIAEYPALVYLRDKSHVFYDGSFDIEDIIQWRMMASKKVLKRLDDKSFEHLTQASTGATTGAWLVAFYTKSCSDILPTMETLGVRIQAKTNVAKVDASESYELVDRFKISSCPEIILFKGGKMYKYNLPKLDVTSLKNFADGFYKNFHAEKVTVPKSEFDYLTENIADHIKAQLEGENKLWVLCGICGLGVISFLIVLFFVKPAFAGDANKKNKKKTE